MLADVFPGIEPWRWLIELVLPVAIVGLVLLGTRPVLRLLARLGGAPAPADARARRRRAGQDRRARPLVHALAGRARPRCAAARTSRCSSSAAACRSSSAPRSIGGSRTVRRTLGRRRGSSSRPICSSRCSRWPPSTRRCATPNLPGYAIAIRLLEPLVRDRDRPRRRRERGRPDRRRVPRPVTAPVLGHRDPRAQAPRLDRRARSSRSTR